MEVLAEWGEGLKKIYNRTVYQAREYRMYIYLQEKKKARGFGFLSYTTEDAVDLAVAEHYVNIQNKQVEIKRAEPRTNISELSNGPLVDQWGTPAQNGVHNGAQAQVTPTYSGWGAPPTLPPPVTQNFTPTAFTVGPGHWGTPPVSQPSHGWGAPPPAQHHNSYAPLAPSHPIHYNGHHFISPNPAPSHTFTTSYWGSPPGPTPPPSTPQEMYSPHAASPQSPHQPKYEMSMTGYHLHPAPGPPEYTRIYQKPMNPPQYSSSATPEYFSPPVVAPVAYAAEPSGPPRIGIPGGYAPPQIGNFHSYRRS